MLPEIVKNQIISNLRILDPEKVILFGSYAYGIPTEDSDIDLYIVTKNPNIPETFAEKIKLKVQISDLLNPIRDRFPLDIIVHTLPMYLRFMELGSNLSQTIRTKGIQLI
ncbi:MAG: nucleotidyltransferase domain-containing protein [Bacteroidota bacterium]|nr:nucleotidyltransferase domain-containing protein [Bacteroidota bacterium]